MSGRTTQIQSEKSRSVSTKSYSLITATSPPQSTINYDLPHPDYTRVSYEVAADHYWTVKEFYPGEEISFLKDLGSDNTLVLQAFRAKGVKQSFLPLNIEGENIQGISVVADDVYGTAFKFTASKQSCVKVVDLANIPRNSIHECLLDPTTCIFGLGVAIWVKLDPLELVKGEKQILYETAGDAGFALYILDKSIHAVVTAGKTRWKSRTSFDLLFTGLWASVGFTWNQEEGIRVFFFEFLKPFPSR